MIELSIVVVIIFISIVIIFFQPKKVNSNQINKDSQNTIPTDTPLPKIEKIYNVLTSSEQKKLKLKNKWIENKIDEIINYSNVTTLLKNTPINGVRYNNLLNCFEWQFKRFKILVRDNYTCEDCKKISDRLHVHHKFYLKDSLPWEIEDSELVSLCRSCHSNRHENETINIYEKVGNQLKLTNYRYNTCWKCNGTGYLSQFKHVENGICFACFGNVINETIFSNRLNQISADLNLYDVGNIENELLDFSNSINDDYFMNHIHNKLYSEAQSEINDFFSEDNKILNSKTIQKQSKESQDDDLPF